MPSAACWQHLHNHLSASPSHKEPDIDPFHRPLHHIAPADRGLLFTGDALVTYDGITGYHGPTVVSRAFTHDSRAALASLTTLGTINATLLLPGHGEPFAGTPADAAAQTRSAGLR